MLQRSVILIWNPQNQGYNIDYIKNYWGQPQSPKNGSENVTTDFIGQYCRKIYLFINNFQCCQYVISINGAKLQLLFVSKIFSRFKVFKVGVFLCNL